MRAIRREMETIAAANVMRMRRGKRQYRRVYAGGWNRFRWSQRGRMTVGGGGLTKTKGNEDEGAWRQKQGRRSASSDRVAHNRSLR